VTDIELAPRLDKRALKLVAGWQQAAGSHEVCGLCALDELGILQLIRLRNHASLGNQFEVAAADDELARGAAEERGWKITAFFHTHPHDGPEMTELDMRSFAKDTLPWIIVGTPIREPRQRLYR
jgi:proteasome lid subunit RPN8/RPN11